MASIKITNDMAKTILERLTSDTPTRSIFNKFKIGTGTNDASETDTDLQNVIPITGTETVDDCEAITGWVDNTNMTISLNETTYKIGVASLNLTKDATTSTQASTSKTTTSLDFTNKTLSIWVYIKDTTTLEKLTTTNALIIRFGTDSTNYYQWTFDNSDLSVGWNLLNNMTSSNASETGTVTLTTCDYTYIQLTSTTSSTVWTAGDILIDDIKLISSDDYVITEITGYPSVDYTTFENTHRAFVSSTQANGYLISEVGLFNTDTTNLLGIRANFNEFSKSNTDELVFIIKNKLQINSRFE